MPGVARSCDHLPDRLGRLVDDADWPIDVGIVLFARFDTECKADGGQEIRHRDGAFLDGQAARSSAADNLPALDAAACQHRAPGSGEMIAAAVGVDPWSAAEFSHPDDHRC